MTTRLRSAFTLNSVSNIAKGLFWASALQIFLNDNVVSVAYVTGYSMMPTLSPNYDSKRETDIVLWNVWSAKKSVQRGDVLQFMSPNDPERFAVKRVIGLPGDTVLLDPRRRPSVKEGPEPPASKAWDSLRGRIVVPAGHVWLEGDNWRKTSDSNWYGPVSKSLITGKAVAVLSPWDRFWTKPWEGWTGRTRVLKGTEPGDWTKAELPVELSELGDLGLGKG